MNKIFRISFALKNTYRVNSILYALKQVPLLKKLLPDSLYSVRALKIFANVLSGVWELVSVFLGKFLYLFILSFYVVGLYGLDRTDGLFMHILLFLTLTGTQMNTGMFDPTRDKYYAMILMRMDARSFTLVNYGYLMLKVVVGFMPFSLAFGVMEGVPAWLCLVMPFSIAGMKLVAASYTLWHYEHRPYDICENPIKKSVWLFTAVMLFLAFGLPAVGIVLPLAVSSAIMLVFIPAGAASVMRIARFKKYREVNQYLLSKMVNQMDDLHHMSKKLNENLITSVAGITSKKKGFYFLNELFVKRHQKILWNASKKITYVCLFIICGAMLLLYIMPEIRETVNGVILTWLPYFSFIMYSINRGTSFTQALFMNCDHSLLTYSFYKKPEFILKLFRIRLMEIVKVNIVPAAVIGLGLPLILFASGGTDNYLNYVVMLVSIIAMSVFFSIHYLTMYYLLQPYNAGTELKSGTYKIVMFITYLTCFSLMQIRIPVLIFGVLCIAFCIVYSVAACVLVYKFAPKTFKLRA